MGHYIFYFRDCQAKPHKMHIGSYERQKGVGVRCRAALRQCSVTQALWDPTLRASVLPLTVVFIYNFKVIEGRSTKLPSLILLLEVDRVSLPRTGFLC